MWKKACRLFFSFISVTAVSLTCISYKPFPIYAAGYSLYDVCMTWASHNAPERTLALADLIDAFHEADLKGIAEALGDYVMSSKTSYLVNNACDAYVNGDPEAQPNVHGGHGRKFDIADQSAQQDLLNGSNYNYYTNNNYNNTKNYSVVNSYNTVNNEVNNYVSYTYNDNTYNYAYYYEDTTYNITNNTYNFHLTNNNYLSVSNTYNSVNIVDAGNTRTLYYELPDGRNSLNLTEEEAVNGYKTSLSVSSYDYLYDDDNLIALYHFDGNEYDSAYPSNTQISFVKNSVQYIDSNQFNQGIAFDRDFSISLNKSGAFYSFRFYPLISNYFKFSLMGSELGSCERIYNTITQYDQFFNDYYIPSSGTYIFLKVNNVYFLQFGVSSPNFLIGSSIENIVNYVNTHDSIIWGNTHVDNKVIIQDEFNFYSTSSTINAYRPVIAVDSGDYSAYVSNGQTVSGITYTEQCNADMYDITGKVTNRSYNYINTSDLESSGICNFINFNMWNYCAIDVSGNVYINGTDTGYDVSGGNFVFSVDADGVTYVDELAAFHSNRSVNSPSYPYDSNIVYAVPNYYISVTGFGIYFNQLLKNNDFSDGVSNWSSFRGSLSASNNILTYTVSTVGTNSTHNRFLQNFTFIQDHVYYFVGDFSGSKNDMKIRASRGTTTNYYSDEYTMSVANTWYKVSGIGTCDSSDASSLAIRYTNVRVIGEVGDFIKCKFINFIDLTQMFGSGYEPDKEWCDEHFDEFIEYNSGELVYNPYDLPSAYDYTYNVLTDVSVNNQLLIQSIIPVNSWKFGGFRPSSPAAGDVFVVVDDLGYITSVQQFNSIEWTSVNAGLFNVYLGKWLNAIGFNIFSNNWDYTDYKYKSDDRQTNIFIQFFTDTFNKIFYSNSNPSEQEVLQSADNNDSNNNDFNDHANTLFQYEDSFSNNFNDATENLQMENPNTWGDDFISSAQWVKQQYDRMTVGTPIGQVLGFSMVIGFVLLIVGRFMR